MRDGHYMFDRYEMKRRLIIGIVLLAAYPLVACVLISLEGHQAIRLTMTQVDLLRLASGLVTFGGFTVLVAEFQSWRQARNAGIRNGSNTASHGTSLPRRP
jgi:hypothetical protein